MTTDEEIVPDFSLPLSDEAASYLWKRFYAIANRYVRNHHDAEDMAQSSVLGLIDGSRKWTNAFRCCRWVVLDILKKQNRSRRADTKYAEELDYEMEVIDSLERHEVDNFFGLGLDEPLRLAAVAYWTNGRTQEEVAKELGVSQMTVSNWLRQVMGVVRERWFDN